jgi:hypothetical protein
LRVAKPASHVTHLTPHISRNYSEKSHVRS